MKLYWKFVDEHPPLHIGLPCIVNTPTGIYIAEYHSDPEGWYDDHALPIYDVSAYIYLHDLPNPMRPTITNDEFVGRVLK